MRVFTCLYEDHNLVLVALAAAICVVGAVVTARMYRRTRESQGVSKLAWLFMGAVAGGATVWCTHFVAMLAYRPGVETAYAPLLTGISLLVAIIGSGVAFGLGAAKARHAPLAGGMTFGAAVAAMHYTGMAAFTAEAIVTWSAVYVVVSVVAAVVGGAAAFAVIARPNLKRPIAWGAVTLVATIVALHFIGMAALTVIPLAPLAGSLNGSHAAELLAAGVAVVGLLMLGIAAASHALEEQAQTLFAHRLNTLIEGSVDGMLVENEGRVMIANAAFVELSGESVEAVIGSLVSRWIDGAEQLETGCLIQSSLKTATGEMIPVEIAVRREDGEGRAFRILAVRDLRARLAQERRISHLARNDSLTGLPNRASFLEKLERTMAVGGEQGGFALLAIDLNRFKEVNDLYGHAVGDHLLVHIAGQMKAAARPGEFVARLGGDEFVAIIPCTDRHEAMVAAERLRTAIGTPTTVEHADLQCGASIGIALWPEDAGEASVLINNSDLAMYRAKATLTTDICFYEEAMDEAVRQRRRITQGLREALDNDRFELHYQLQASVETGEITGYEALLRWPQEDGSYIPPCDFIPVAEDTGLILPIGEWVLRRACQEAAAWDAPICIAVNLSPIQLSNVDLPRLVHQVLLETGLAPSRLELEITETAMISDLARTTHVLRQLKALGVSVAMDDFGTGYSSLSTLRAFPFDKIKLDRSFMLELDGSPQSRAIIRAVLAIGESLAIPVLAEGVETAAQLEFLKVQGCDQVQGFLLGRPSRDAVENRVALALAASAA